MNSSTTRSLDDPDLVRWGLLALALVTAAFLMVYYVQLLQDAVARGAQSRYAQTTSAASGLSGSAAPARMQLISANR